MYVQQNENTINMNELNVNEIKSIIASLANSAAGYDEIPTSIMKQRIHYYAEP